MEHLGTRLQPQLKFYLRLNVAPACVEFNAVFRFGAGRGGCIGGGGSGGSAALVKVLAQVGGGGAQPSFIITKDSILVIQNLNDYSSRHALVTSILILYSHFSIIPL